MKKLLHFLFLVVMTTTTNKLFAQTDNYKLAIENFKKSYNAEKYDEIFNSFDVQMQKALPIKDAEQFFVGIKTQYGNIETMEFSGYKSGVWAVFKVKFEKEILAVNLALDKQNKINGLNIDEYKEPTPQAKNGLKTYPKEVSDLIFTQCKDFADNTHVSVAIIKDGKTNYYGIIRTNGVIQQTENQSNIFEIGSITKVFTSTVLASLVVENKLKLTDNINDFYAFKFKDNTKISFESLANHTSKLSRMPENIDLSDKENPYKSYGKKELEYYLENLLKIDQNTPKTHSYSNLGAGILGHTLGLSQKITFQNLLQKRVFDKYKMKSSFVSSQNLGNKLVKGQDESGKIVSNWDLGALFSAGGILSTTEDLAKFAIAQFDPKNKELALTRKPTFEINKNKKIGLGWHIKKLENESEFIYHNGGTGGYTSCMAVSVESKTAVIILSNVSAFSSKAKNVDGLCFELMKQTK